MSTRAIRYDAAVYVGISDWQGAAVGTDAYFVLLILIIAGTLDWCLPAKWFFLHFFLFLSLVVFVFFEFDFSDLATLHVRLSCRTPVGVPSFKPDV